MSITQSNAPAPEKSEKPVLRLDRICLKFGDKRVLNGIDLSVVEGEVVVLIGASGSGKTSLLRCINLLNIPTSGSIVIGDEDAPYKREIKRFHSSLASLAEITAFVMLGLTIRQTTLGDAGAWAAGLALAALLAFVIRPVLAGLVSLPVRLSLRERVFFLWTGLKGAVPILLGMMIVQSGTAGAARAYEIIFVIVGFSVTLQGGLVPALAHRLRIPLRTVEPEPWSLGVRFATEPEGMHRYRVVPGAPADGATVGELPCGENAWVSLIIRNGSLAPVTADTALRAGDDVLVLADPDDADALGVLFTGARSVR